MVERKQIDPRFPITSPLQEILRRIEQQREFEGEVFSHPLASEETIRERLQLDAKNLNFKG